MKRMRTVDERRVAAWILDQLIKEMYRCNDKYISNHLAMLISSLRSYLIRQCFYSSSLISSP